MSTATIVALATAIPAILGAITALIVAIKNNSKVNAHLESPVPHASENRH